MTKRKLMSLVAVMYVAFGVISNTIKSPAAAEPVVPPPSGEPMDIWWPTDGARINGVQPIKALLPGRDINTYTMGWSVDNGSLVDMPINREGYPHKENYFDVSGWDWRGNGPYIITLVAKDMQNAEISRRSVAITIDRPTAVSSSATTVSSVSSSVVSSEASSEASSTPVSSSIASSVSTSAVSSSVTPASSSQSASATVLPPVEVWWPTEGAVLGGTQPFKALVKDRQVEQYAMELQVDDKSPLTMLNNYQDYPHKEVAIDVSKWDWSDDGSYVVRFTATDLEGRVIARTTVNVRVSGAKSTGTTGKKNKSSSSAPVISSSVPAMSSSVSSSVSSSASSVQSSVSSSVTPPPPTSGNPLAGQQIYANPDSNAKRTADSWRSTRPADAAMMDKVAAGGGAVWLGNWNSNITSDTNNVVSAAASMNAVPVLIAYNIPQRDCGGYSANGLNSADGYRQWIRGIAQGIGSRRAVVVLEPDALTLTDCLSATDRQMRFSLLKEAVTILRSNAQTSVYLDAGHPGWLSATEMAGRLNQAGIEIANGFALNTSNFQTDDSNVNYGQAISAQTGNKHFVVDSSRNGLGPAPDNQWCNPSGRALGRKPTAATGNALVDAFLWLKTPGESDGSCNGAPSAGTWWPDYALGLAQRAAW